MILLKSIWKCIWSRSDSLTRLHVQRLFCKQLTSKWWWKDKQRTNFAGIDTITVPFNQIRDTRDIPSLSSFRRAVHRTAVVSGQDRLWWTSEYSTINVGRIVLQFEREIFVMSYIVLQYLVYVASVHVRHLEEVKI